MKVKYLRGTIKGSDSVATKIYSDKYTDCQFLLIKVNNKEGQTKTTEEVALAIQTPDDLDALVKQLQALKAKIKKPSLTPQLLICQRCGKQSSDVHEDVDPYVKELQDREILVTCCEECFREKRRDI